MKRLSILAMTALMAFFLTACGENAEKKIETTAETAVDSAKSSMDDAAKPADAAAPADTTAAPADAAAPADSTEQPAQ